MPIFFGGPAFSYFVSKKVTTEWVDFGAGGTVNPGGGHAPGPQGERPGL